MNAESNTRRQANVDAKRAVRSMLDASSELSLREKAALCRRAAKRALYSFNQVARDDTYHQAYWSVEYHEYLSWEQHYRRTYRAEEAAR